MNIERTKVPIKTEKLRYWIKRRGGSVEKLSSRIGISSKTIQRGLSCEELSIDLVYLLAFALDIDVYVFADISEYKHRITSKIKD